MPNTNKSKSPEVIYVGRNRCTDGLTASETPWDCDASYTRSDKVEELKEVLRQLVNAVHTAEKFDDWAEIDNALTKALTLLQ